LNRLSKLKSATAFAIYTVLSLPLFIVVLAMAAVFAPVAEPRKIPPELVGWWQAERFNPSQEIYERDSYNFAPEGLYSDGSTKAFKEGNCTIFISKVIVGQVSVEGSTLTLTPQQGTKTTENKCSGEKSEAPMELNKEVYHYQIHQQACGWVLCLAGRFGEQCLTPTKF
jgi:hypothetical protein